MNAPLSPDGVTEHPEGGVTEPPGRSRRRSPWFLPILWVMLVVTVTAVIVVWRGTDRYYAYSPGTAPEIVSDASCRLNATAGDLVLPGGTPCAKLTVPTGKAHLLHGRLLMVDVLVGPANAEQYVFDKLGLLSRLMPGTQLVPAAEVLGTTPAAQLTCEDNQQMTSATESATVAVLRTLRYPVSRTDVGIQVDTVSAGSPAAAAGVECNDTITAINGNAVRTLTDLRRVLGTARPGQTAKVVLQRAGTGRAVTKVLAVKLGGTPAEGGQPPVPRRPFLGIAAQPKVTYTFPFKVGIDVGNIGGPSAGLALTLRLFDLLTNGDLTGGHRVAATGTIDAEGDVGDVGGVAQKTVAVERAGAQLFLVPAAELAVADKAAGCHGQTTATAAKTTSREVCGRMNVEAVSTLSQALADLSAIGGHPATVAQGR